MKQPGSHKAPPDPGNPAGTGRRRAFPLYPLKPDQQHKLHNPDIRTRLACSCNPWASGSCARPQVGLTQQEEDGREEPLQATIPPNSRVAKGLVPLQGTRPLPGPEAPQAPALGGPAIAKGPLAGGGRLRIPDGGNQAGRHAEATRGLPEARPRGRRARLRWPGRRAEPPFPGVAWAKGCSRGEASSDGPPRPPSALARTAARGPRDPRAPPRDPRLRPAGHRSPCLGGRPPAAPAEEPLLGGHSRRAAPASEGVWEGGAKTSGGKGIPAPRERGSSPRGGRRGLGSRSPYLLVSRSKQRAGTPST